MSRFMSPAPQGSQNVSPAPRRPPFAPRFAPASLQAMPREVIDCIIDMATRDDVTYNKIASLSSAFRQTALAHAKQGLRAAPKLKIAAAPCLLQTDWSRLSKAHRWLESVVAAEANKGVAESDAGTRTASVVGGPPHAMSTSSKKDELNAMFDRLDSLGPIALGHSLDTWMVMQPNKPKALEARSRIMTAYRTGGLFLNLSGYDLVTLPTGVIQINTLQTLDCMTNQLTSLPESLGHLKALRKLSVDGNYLRLLPRSIGALTELRRLSVGCNRLESLPLSIGRLTALRRLSLGINQLRSLPAEIGQLKDLRALHVYTNHLETLPEVIGQLSALQVLDICDNRLTVLPQSIGQLTALRWLGVSGNALR